MTQSIRVGEHFEPLRGRLHGELTLPGEPGWDVARAAWQLLADQHPAAVVDAADVHDVVETVREARRLGLAVAPQGTGHGAGGIATLDGAILLRTARLDAVRIDPEARVAHVGGGARWGAVAAAAAEHGLAVVAGMAPTVGVAGFLLGGGLGWFARSHGLGSDGIVALEVVDAQGRELVVDETQNADLLWAARGGSLPAIVTGITIRLHVVPELHAGALMWPAERAADVIPAWRDWVVELPESVTALVRVLRLPPLPELPEPLRGRAFVVVEAAIQEDAATAERMLAPLRALGPEIDTVAPTTPVDLGAVHGDPPMPSAGYGGSLLLSEVSEESVAALLAAVLDPASAPLVSIELRHLGGALARERPDEGAVTALAGEGIVYAIGIVPVPEALAPARAAVDAVLAHLRPFGATRQVKTFTERPASAEALYGEAAARRLRRIAGERDPDGLLRAAHPLS